MRILLSLKLIVVLILFYTNAFAVDVLVWGPHKYERTSGEPNVYTETIAIAPGESKLIVKNGQQNGDNKIVDSLSSAKVYVNNTLFFAPNNFNKNVYILEASVNLTGNDEISVELASNPGSYLTVEIMKDIELPPDPGEAGEQTLLGIDSDNDGVRDDIQRYIYITYPREERVRLALFQTARVYQELLLHSDDPEIVHENVKKLYRSMDCLYYIKNGVDNAMDIDDELNAKILNTKERSLKYIKSNNNLAGKTTKMTPIEERKNCCLFDVDNTVN